jgi:hypothetical protein
MCTLFSWVVTVFVFSCVSICLNIIRSFITYYLGMTHNSVRMELIVHEIFTCDPPLILMEPLKALPNINFQWIFGVAWLEIYWLGHSLWQHLTAANQMYFLMNKVQLLMEDKLLETMLALSFNMKGSLHILINKLWLTWISITGISGLVMLIQTLVTEISRSNPAWFLYMGLINEMVFKIKVILCISA